MHTFCDCLTRKLNQQLHNLMTFYYGKMGYKCLCYELWPWYNDILFLFIEILLWLFENAQSNVDNKF
jgi:hypothetical protein